MIAKDSDTHVTFMFLADDEGNFEDSEESIKRVESVDSINKIMPIPDGSSFFLFASKNP